MSATDIGALAGLFLTVVAFVLAIYQTMQAQKQSKELKVHEASLSTISSALSTRYLGPFPGYLKVALELVDRAESEILIVNDNPVPAYFSEPLLWIDYRRALEYKMRSGVSVTLVSVSAKQRLRRMHDQFSRDPADWPSWQAENQQLLDYYLKTQFPQELNSTLTKDRFMAMLIETQDRLTADVFAHAQRFEVDDIVTLQVWIADMKEAVFTIETTSENSLSHGLYTSDPKFVSALFSVAELYRSTWNPPI